MLAADLQILPECVSEAEMVLEHWLVQNGSDANS